MILKTRALKPSLGRSPRSERSENGRKINRQPLQTQSGDLNLSLQGVAALRPPGGVGGHRKIPRGEHFQLMRGVAARRKMGVVAAAVPRTMVAKSIELTHLHLPASEEWVLNEGAASPAVEMRVIQLHHAGSTRNLHLRTVKMMMKILAVNTPGAVLGLAGAILPAAHPGAPIQAAQMLLQTRAATAGNVVTQMTAIVTTVTGHEDIQSVLMTQKMTQIMPAQNIGPRGTNTHPPKMTTASAVASHEAGHGVILESDLGPGAGVGVGAEAAAVVAVGANEEAGVLQPTAGRGVGAIAGTEAAAHEALPRDQIPERAQEVMKALRRDDQVAGISSVLRSIAPSPHTTIGQVEQRGLERKMGEGMTVKGLSHLPRIALAKQGCLMVIVARKIKIQSLLSFY